jgi:tRNA pseudouridine55 synthase
MEERYQKIIANNESDANSGFILIDKEKDWTSFDVVAKLRGITKIKKIGHAGTLDPFATGLLIVAIGRATKLLQLLLGQNKSYTAEMILGKTSNTYDITGEITSTKEFTQNIEQAEIEKALQTFTGQQKQIPPMFSAKKIQGKKLYELARQGIEVERTAKDIEIYKIELLEYNFPKLTFFVNCSTGTYIRTIAYDLGNVLGCGGLLENLRRLNIAKADISTAHSIEEVSKDWRKYLLPVSEINKWL